MRLCPPCGICCTICAQTLPVTPFNHAFGNPTPHNEQPFALNKLLAAGIVTLARVPEAEPSLCDHVHADDGWHKFDGLRQSGYLEKDDARLAKQLCVLSRHDFIKITYNITDEETLTLRIYIVPADLKDVKGKLRQNNRKEAILNQGRRFLRELLPKICQDGDQWYGRSKKDVSASCGLIYAPPDARTLAEIYSDLASPRVDSNFVNNKAVTRLLDRDDGLEGLGLRSVLYKYQRRSIAAMITRELDSRAVPDPLYIALSTINGKEFFFQPGTMEFLEERGMVQPARGGILCEELGTGKTVMVLGLILSSISQLPSPPETSAGTPIVLTPLALKAFPSGPFAAARSSILQDKSNFNETISRVPPLVDVLLHLARASPPAGGRDCNTPESHCRREKRLEIESRFEMTPMNELLQKNLPFYSVLPEDTNESWSFRRSRIPTGSRIMFLSAATLVVVPPNLLGQWHREINKHCEYPLRVLILRSGSKMPPTQALANDYDIILTTYNRYTAEAAHKDIWKLHSLPPCECACFPASHIPDCNCPEPDGVSPFLRIRWKRLVIDEGHVAASLSTNLIPFTKLLSVENRWIITGTPTTNLLGLSLGKNSISEFVSHTGKEDDPYDDQTRNTPESEADESRSSDYEATSSNVKRRIWNKYDREDLNKLDNMITHFIAVPHLLANTKLVSTHLRDPLMDKEGPLLGSIQVLNQVMDMIMIRHRIEDVEKDVVLPPVVHESVLLDLDPVVAKSYNALQATIAINAIDSQRVDQDYLFHPRNAEYLQLTVKNMSQVMFWHVDETLYNVDQLMENAHATIERAMARNMPPEDIQLVQEALRHIQLAATDQLWRQIQTHEDVPYRVYNMSRRLVDAWTRTPGAEKTNTTDLVHADRLLKLHDLITSRPLLTEDLLVEQAAEVVKSDKEHRQAFEETYKRSKNKHIKKYTQGGSKTAVAAATTSSEIADVHAGFMVENAAKKAVAPDTLKAMRKELDESLARLERDDEEESSAGLAATAGSLSPGIRTSTGSGPSPLLRSSVLANVVVGSSASSKLNYIMDEVTKYSAHEKILIFSDSELTLAHVAEALELIQVKFLRFTTLVEPQIREQLVLTFETSETYRVFLMELKHGARGLNLISASRVIFCEPVWQADVESQAIKRAHRIGQTRFITVKTLAIRGTAEENMVERRNLLKGSHDKLPKLIEESGMRHFIANPKFLTHVPEKLPTIEFPLIRHRHLSPSPPLGSTKLKIPASHPPSPSPRSVSSSSQKYIAVEDPFPRQAIDGKERSPQKKVKLVHFG